MLYKQELIHELETVQCSMYYSRSDCPTVGRLPKEGSMQHDSIDGLLEVVIQMLPPRWLNGDWMDAALDCMSVEVRWRLMSGWWIVQHIVSCSIRRSGPPLMPAAVVQWGREPP